MNVRVSRLFRAHHPHLCVLPSITKRCLAHEATPDAPPPSTPIATDGQPRLKITWTRTNSPEQQKAEKQNKSAEFSSSFLSSEFPTRKGVVGVKIRKPRSPRLPLTPSDVWPIPMQSIPDGHGTIRADAKANQRASSVYESLLDIYEIDGSIPRGKPLNTLSDRTTTDGVPLWGEWGIPLKIRSFGGPTVIILPSLWLRDNCRCDKCVNQDTMQRAFDTFSIPRDILPSEVVTGKDGLRVTWSNDGHVSLFPWEWIMKYSDRLANHADAPKNTKITWGAEIAENPPSVHYDEIMADDAGVGRWTSKIHQYGFCYVDGCPISPEKTQELLERIAFIRVTHYGGFYDFTSDLSMKDTAYTTLALPAHTDTTYFTDPAGLQMFHLLSHEQGSGGQSLLVDGFKAARILEDECILSHKALSRISIPWHASGNEGITITPIRKFPVLNHYYPHDHGTKRQLMQVRWNNDDRGVVDLEEARGKPGRGTEQWYNAARKWNEILKRKDMEYWAQLEPGRPLIFDNWRVLHGRSAFSGKRRIAGGYINHDDYISRWRNTNFTREEALKQIL
ncbi:hypothetical protein G7Y89_g11634 [Cudoniella acicularis]|uniref:trimethyllysine dioxygenase n=1 Tax=Cudoniella acicularis TaxID=354080 RepID=A0A8H4RAJ8_9HELO|nr:hypothetical protein G7Y89_g11634 [Cudoniella acicularis]